MKMQNAKLKIKKQVMGEIPVQKDVPWLVTFKISWGSLRRRLLRSLVTMTGVVLAIAFLAHMLITDSIIYALVEVNERALNILLQKSDVDISNVGTGDSLMVLFLFLTLLITLVGISNSMFMAVTERVREIGTLKCLGAHDNFIIRSFLIESSLQGVLGTLCGIILGMTVALSVALVSYQAYVFKYFPLAAVIKALMISFVIGTVLSVVASIIPAYMAARKQPVEALRHEE